MTNNNRWLAALRRVLTNPAVWLLGVVCIIVYALVGTPLYLLFIAGFVVGQIYSAMYNAHDDRFTEKPKRGIPMPEDKRPEPVPPLEGPGYTVKTRTRGDMLRQIRAEYGEAIAQLVQEWTE